MKSSGPNAEHVESPNIGTSPKTYNNIACASVPYHSARLTQPGCSVTDEPKDILQVLLRTGVLHADQRALQHKGLRHTRVADKATHGKRHHVVKSLERVLQRLYPRTAGHAREKGARARVVGHIAPVISQKVAMRFGTQAQQTHVIDEVIVHAQL